MDFLAFMGTWWDAIASHFANPNWLIGIPIALVVLFIITRLNTVRYAPDSLPKIRRMRVLVFLFRFVAISLVLVALAAPFTTVSHETEGDPHALVLIDESGSMDLYDLGFTDSLVANLQKELPTTVRRFGSDLSSPIGDAALGHPEHVLLISDGNANEGVDLLDVAQLARSNNLSINMIDLSAKTKDSAVVINAPNSIPLGFPATIDIEVTSTSTEPVPLVVLIDGREVHKGLDKGIVEIKPQLGAGYHRIEARITSEDANPGNNAHYRVVQVLEKPKIFVLSDHQGELERSLAGLFDTTVSSRLPTDLSPYYAIVMDDVSAQRVGSTGPLADFLRDEQYKYGNGLVVVGGFHSFDRGNYQNTQLESLLPIKVGKPKRDLGENNLVFVIQVSGSTGGVKYVAGDGGVQQVTESEPTIEVIKAQAVSAINSLNLRNNVGVVAFGVQTTGQSFDSAQQALEASVVKISDVKPLYQQKQELTDKIPRLTGGGTTAPDIALRAAVDMLKDKSGDKTIILLTNGRFSAGIGAGSDVPAKANTLAIVQNAYRRYGIKTQTLGVGSTDDAIFAKKVDESFLVDVAKAGESTYDRATNMRSLMVKYGDPQEKGFGDSFNLVPLSLTHFITRDVELDAILNGYNEVAPKDGSRMLVSTDFGMPALTTWNYFNGRVAALTVFTGDGLGPLLRGSNSDLVRNTVLWAVGDPGRKANLQVDVTPAIVGEPAQITFTSKEPISGDCKDTPVQFESSTGDAYVFSFTPKTVGFGTVCNVPYAANGPSEYWRAGVSEKLRTAVQVSDGGIFEPDAVDSIVDQIKTVSKRLTVERREVRNPFLALALIVFLLEIFIRRLSKLH